MAEAVAAPVAVPVKEVAGKVISVEGDVVAVDTKTGATRTLHVGDKVFIGELITTAKGASIDLGMVDGRNQEVHNNSKVLLQHDVTSGAGNASTALDNAVHVNTDTSNILNNALQLGSTLNSVVQGAGTASSSASSSAMPPPNTFHSPGVSVDPPT
ncbi:MAG: FecR family protein, partial [Burkholderiales bacterium]